MPILALKVDVDTYRGTEKGVPHLLNLFKRHQVGATFLFSLGPDHTGRAMRRIFNRGFFQKVSRTSVVKHYGLTTLMYGVCLPGPQIGLKCLEQCQLVQQAAFECGIHAWDHVSWQDNVRHQDKKWTHKHMVRAYDRYTHIFNAPPLVYGAAGWQMNAHALEALDAFGIKYASNTRSHLYEDGQLMYHDSGPYRMLINEKPLNYIELPTTLPTLDELIGRVIKGNKITPHNVAEHLLTLTLNPRDHVFTLHAELEGLAWMPILETLLDGFKKQGYEICSLGEYARTLSYHTLPSQPITWGEIPGRSGQMLVA